jgi:hypothetical protein
MNPAKAMSPGRPENRPGCHYIGLTRSDAVSARYFYEVSDLLFSFAVIARCFFAVVLRLRASKARVSAAERGPAAVFSRLYQRYQRAKRGFEKLGVG